MFKFQVRIMWTLVAGIFASSNTSYATQRKMPDIHCVAAVNRSDAWISGGILNPYAHMQQGFSERVRELSFTWTPGKISASPQALQLEMVAQRPVQMAQASKEEFFSSYRFGCSELQRAEQVNQYAVKISSFSLAKLKVANDALVKDLNNLQGDLHVWENLRRGLLNSMGFSENDTYRDIQNSMSADQLSNSPELETRYWQNEKRICDIQNSMTFKAECLEQVQTLLKAAEVRNTTHTPLKAAEANVTMHTVQSSEITTASPKDNSVQITMSAKEQVVAYSRFESALKTLDSVQFLDPLDREVLAAFRKVAATKGLQQDIVIESEITREGYEGLKSAGIDPEKFKISFMGNALQKYFTSKVHGMINNSGNTFAGSQNTNIRAYAEATDHVCEAAHDMIRANDPLQALILTNLASLCDQATAVAKGFVCGTARGMLESVEGIVDIIKDPEQFVDNCRTVVRLWLSINDEGKLEGDDKLLRKIAGMYNEFDQLPFAQKVECTSAMVATIAGPVKVTRTVFKALASVTKVIKFEAATLRTLQLPPLTSMKGALVPFKYTSTMLKLISNGTVKTGQEITRWLKLLNGPLNWGMTEAIHDVIKPIANAFSKEKIRAAATTQQVTKIATKVAAVALTASSLASASFGTSALIEAASKSIISSSLARQGVETATSAVGDASQIAKSTLVTVSEGVASTSLTSAMSSASAAAASETKAFMAVQQVAQETASTSGVAKAVANEVAEASAKISKEEAALANKAVVVANEIPKGFKAIANNKGRKFIGQVDYFPLEAPLDKESYAHAMRAQETCSGKVSGGHMATIKQPWIVPEVTGGPNEFGVKRVTLELGNAKSYGKTVCPEGWNQVTYVRRWREAYANTVNKECQREGRWILTGVDKGGMTWEMCLELKNGIHRLVTGYPTL